MAFRTMDRGLGSKGILLIGIGCVFLLIKL